MKGKEKASLLTGSRPITYKNINYKSIDITDRLPDFLEKHSDIPILLLILLGKQKGSNSKEYTSPLKYTYGGVNAKANEFFDVNGRLKYLNNFLYNDYKPSVRDAQNYLKPNSYTGNLSDYIVKTSARKNLDSNNGVPYIEQIKNIINDQNKSLKEIKSDKRQAILEKTQNMVDNIEKAFKNPSLASSGVKLAPVNTNELLSPESDKLVKQIESLLD